MFQHSVSSEKILKVQADKRRSQRVNSAFSGAISSGGEFICHCIIKDVSNDGMCLSVSGNIDLPAEFDIKTPAVPDTMRVELQWNKGKMLGVTFKKYETVDVEANVQHDS